MKHLRLFESFTQPGINAEQFLLAAFEGCTLDGYTCEGTGDDNELEWKDDTNRMISSEWDGVSLRFRLFERDEEDDWNLVRGNSLRVKATDPEDMEALASDYRAGFSAMVAKATR